MPVDPTISLNVTGGNSGLSSAGAVAPVNPLTLAGTYADVQNKLNTNKAFQLTLAAKQKLGQIMSTSPDIPTAIQRAQQDPSVAPFVPELVQTIAGTQESVQRYKQGQQTQNADAFSRAAALLPGEMVEEGSVKKNLPAVLRSIPDPGVRATVSDSMNHILEGLTTDLPDEPVAREAELMKRITAAGLQTGSLEAMGKLWAQPKAIDTGGEIRTGTEQGPIPTIADRKPGDFQASGNALTKSLAPQITQTGGVIVGGRNGNGGGGSAGGGTGAAAPVSGFSALEGRIGGDGKPLVPKGYSGLAPVISRGTGTGGSNVLSPEQQTISQQLAKDFAGPEKTQFDAANQAIGSLDEMDRNVDIMARKGGLLTPGSFGDTRLAFGKAVNTVATAFGAEPPFDPSSVAAGEDILKNTQRMGISTLQTMLGSQREAAETIKNMTERGVPGLDNSVMGFKVVASSIKAAAQRQLDLREFEKAWASDPRNQGNLTGAVEEFNKLKPASGYINKALDNLGMDSAGFKTSDDVITARNKGFLTEKQALEILNTQFPTGKRKE